MSVPIGSRNVPLVIYIIPIVIGVVFFLFGTFMLSSYGDKGSCTEQVTAKVVRMEKHTSRSSGKYHRTNTTYAPVFEYEYDGRQYTYTSSVAVYPPEFTAGERVTIWVDPSSPNKIYYEPGKSSVLLCIVFRIAGGIAAIGGLALLIVRKAKTKSLDL